ncbi:MAG: hypothetical protein PHX38_02520 [Sulfuricella sp.]|nr:hypothetical protein [Sulfuricella sp.]
MSLNLENALARIAELESRVVRLEQLVIGSSELGIKTHPPGSPPQFTDVLPTLTQTDPPLPLLDSALIETFLIAGTKPSLQPQAIRVKSAIEEVYPKIMEKIVLIWGHPECAKFLNNLMIDDRGNRQGFSVDVMGELMLLAALAEHGEPDMWADFIKIGDRR